LGRLLGAALEGRWSCAEHAAQLEDRATRIREDDKRGRKTERRGRKRK
jgi:hypothetical protein